MDGLTFLDTLTARCCHCDGSGRVAVKDRRYKPGSTDECRWCGGKGRVTTEVGWKLVEFLRGHFPDFRAMGEADEYVMNRCVPAPE